MTYNKKEVDAEFELIFKTLPSDKTLNISEGQIEARNRQDVKDKWRVSMEEANASPEVYQNRSEAQLIAQNNPSTRAKSDKSIREAMNREDVKQLVSERTKEALNSEGMFEVLSAAQKKVAANRTPERKAEISIALSKGKRPKHSKEVKALYRKALKKGPMKCNSHRYPFSWKITAQYFGLNRDSLMLYAKGKHLEDLE